MTDTERAAYVALATTSGIGPHRMAALLAAFDTASGALAAPFAFLGRVPGLSRAAATAVSERTPADGARILAALDRLGGRTLTPQDADYPDLLRSIPDPPALLFALGDLGLLQPPALALVGSRNHTDYGTAVCRRLAAIAAASGLAVVSGMARGLDAEAHLAALEAGGPTIGILGNGLGVVYPAANRVLYERVMRHGLLLTEFPPGERPRAGHFQRRNRLISGLARVTIVVEAAVASGTLITVAAALEQGREVMAVPGNITSRTSAGTNRLIRDGAAPLLEAADLLAHYPEVTRRPAAEGTESPAAEATPPAISPPTAPLSPGETEILARLRQGPRHLDDLVDGGGVGQALAALCALELRGLVRQRPGRQFEVA